VISLKGLKHVGIGGSFDLADPCGYKFGCGLKGSKKVSSCDDEDCVLINSSALEVNEDRCENKMQE
jgi:hypothetical protein